MLSPDEVVSKREEREKRRSQRRLARRKNILSYIIYGLMGTVLLSLSAYYSYYSKLPFTMGHQSETSGSAANLLFFGLDSGMDAAPRADSIIVVSIEPKDGSVHAIAIPRDTRVPIEGRSRPERVNTAYSYGGPELLVSTVENVLGIDIDYYVGFNYDGFESAVDTLGGVVIDVEKRMFYEDKAQNLVIDLKPGVQRLSGTEALQYVRYRSDGLGDISVVEESPTGATYGGRVNRQLKFVKAFLEQAFSARGMINTVRAIGDLRGSVMSNMPPDVAFRLAQLFNDLDGHRIVTAVLPGETETIGHASYWSYDEAKMRELVNKLVYRDDMVTVEVLNGNGISGSAARVANTLRESGFEVVSVGNAEHFDYATTAVIAESHRLTAAERIVRLLGGQAYAEKRTDMASSVADIVVIIGKDLPN